MISYQTLGFFAFPPGAGRPFGAIRREASVRPAPDLRAPGGRPGRSAVAGRIEWKPTPPGGYRQIRGPRGDPIYRGPEGQAGVIFPTIVSPRSRQNQRGRGAGGGGDGEGGGRVPGANRPGGDLRLSENSKGDLLRPSPVWFAGEKGRGPGCPVGGA